METRVERTDYVADSNPDLTNPERGMYSGDTPNFGDENLPLKERNYHTIVPEWLWLAPVCDENLVWDPINDNTSPVLKKYAEEKLDKARSEGYKILFRPRYDQRDPEAQEGDPPEGPSNCKFDDGGSAKVFHAASRKRQFDHIEAVAAMLGDYKDVIAFIQAGYLGNWGEWNTEKDDAGEYDMTNAPLLYNRTDRDDIIDHVLSTYAAAGIAQDVELRRPVFAKEVVERNASANVGLHNDCFMSSTVLPNSSSDGGTYSDFQIPLGGGEFDPDGSPQNFGNVQHARDWAEDWTEHSSFGGETCPNEEHPNDERWRSCTLMTGTTSEPAEPASLHMNYLNHDYAEDAVDEWEKGGCYEEIRRRLGYRFEVTRVEYPETVSAGETFSVAVDVVNTGWARLHKPRDAKLMLRNGATSHGPYTFSDGPPVSNWAPGQPAATITATIAAGGDPPPPPGTYEVRLWIPDLDFLDFLERENLKPDDYPEANINYAVKLATKRNDANGDSVNVFDQTTAENDLGVKITVQ